MRLFKLFFQHLLSQFSPLKWYQNLIRNPKTRTITIVLTLVYLISPIDLIPDFIPILGWIDDAVLASILFGELARMLRDYSQNRQTTKANNNPQNS